VRRRAACGFQVIYYGTTLSFTVTSGLGSGLLSILPFFIMRYANVCYFTNGRTKACLSEGFVPVTDSGDTVLSQRVILTVGLVELDLSIDDAISLAEVMSDVMRRAMERMDQFDREGEVLPVSH
jgi:hypothetical protein